MNKIKKFVFAGASILGIMLMFFGVYSYGNQILESSAMEMVSHSEYFSGEVGQVVGKLYSFNGNPIPANCNVTIYNPDKSTYLAPTTTDDTLEATDGTHFINFTTPSVEGIYEYMIECGFTLNNKYQTRKISNSFHLSPALNMIATINGTTTNIKLNLDNLMQYVDTNFTFQNGQLVEINGIVYQLNSSQNWQNIILGDINTTVNGLALDEDYEQGMLQLINSTTQEILVNITGIDTQVKDIRQNIFTDTNAFNNFTNIQNNFNVVNTKLDAINQTVQGLASYCSDPTTNSSVLCQLVWDNNNKITDIQNTINNVVIAKLDIINQTTQNTYNYMTTTLATNVNNIYDVVLGIQTTVNDINSTVNNINTNVNDVKINLTTVISNQEDSVIFDVTS